jgi:hypothetical protein
MRTYRCLSAAVVCVAVPIGTTTLVAKTAPPATQADVRFASVDVYVDSGALPLAAYQCEIRATAGDVKVVGIEGNAEVAAFATPPYYDPKALLDKRLILAAFSTGTDLPTARTRVATIHVRIAGDVEPAYSIELTVAADADGHTIPATASVEGGTHDDA